MDICRKRFREGKTDFPTGKKIRKLTTSLTVKNKKKS
jgi:hypothetical protein